MCWFFKKGILRKIKEWFENHGSSVIKEIFIKQGILKPGNFFSKYIILKLFKKPKTYVFLKCSQKLS